MERDGPNKVVGGRLLASLRDPPGPQIFRSLPFSVVTGGTGVLHGTGK